LSSIYIVHARFQAGRAVVAPVNDYDEIDSDEEEDDCEEDEAVEELTGDVILVIRPRPRQ
jgi:hypothetical protein